ncbi:unnamed protein product [Caenorhabditis brenneri]
MEPARKWVEALKNHLYFSISKANGDGSTAETEVDNEEGEEMELNNDGEERMDTWDDDVESYMEEYDAEEN